METLRHIREQAGLSQPELSELSGVAQGTISDIERGKRKPRGRTLRKLAQVLGVEVADLLGESETLKGQAPLPEPSFEDALAEERRARWEAAVEDARRLREGGRAQLAELLAAWQASRQRGELRSARRGYLDEIVQLFNKAYGAAHGLADILFAEGGIPAEDDWEEVRAADRFYGTLIEMMRNAGFQIQERKSEPPEVEEPDAA